MPSGPEARRLAAAAEASAALSAVHCAVLLLQTTASPGREQQLLAAIDQALVRAERATRRLAEGET
jgi:hypothetical protein